MFQYILEKLPANFNLYSIHSFDMSLHKTWQNTKSDIFLPRFLTSRTQWSIKYVGRKTWNSILSDLKNLS